MTDYLMLLRGGEAAMEEFSDAEKQAHIDEWGQYMGGLAQSGHFKGGAPLGTGAKVISGTNREQSEGTYAQGEPVGGYIVVSADSLDGAVKLTEGCPIFSTGGSAELREISHM